MYMNITFDLFMRLETICMFFLLAIFYFVAISYIFRSYYDRLFFFLRKNIVKDSVSYHTGFVFDYLNLNTFCLRYLILLVTVFYFFFNYNFMYIYDRLLNYFQFFNYCCIYGNLIIILLFIYLFLLYYNRYDSSLKGVEHLFGIIFLFLNMYYYLFTNSLISIIFLFELQSIVFIYFTAILHYNYYNFDHFKMYSKNLSKSLNFQCYLNSLFFQFCISFIGAIFFIYGVFYIYRFTSFFDCFSIEIFFFFYKYSCNMISAYDIIFMCFVFFVGLLLKIGFFPFFLCKPELYKNSNIFVLFFFMFIYLFFVLFFFFIFFNNYFLLIKDLWYIYVYYIYTLTVLIVLFFLSSINDLRSFLAYSSVLNLSFLLIILTFNSYFSFSLFLFYLFIYSFYIFNFFILLFLLSNNFLCFFSDLQFFSNLVFLTSFFFCFFFGLAGIPPFFGFFSKISIISFLLCEEQYFLFFMSLFTGLFSAFFYLQTYRFSGFSLKNINFSNRTITFKFSGVFMFLNYFVLFLNFLSFFFLADVYNIILCITNNV